MKSQHKGHQRRLARPCGAEQRRDGTGFGAEVHALEHGLVRLIGEVKIAECDPGEWFGERPRVDGIDDIRFEIEQVERPVETDEQVLRHAPDPHQAVA